MGNIIACHNCAYNGKADPRCISCKRANQDDIRIKKTPHVKGDMANDKAMPPPPPSAKYEADAENVLQLIYAITELTPLEFVAAVHLARGTRRRDLAQVFDTIADYARNSKTINRTKRGGRSLIGMKVKSMSNNPIIAKFFGRIYEGDDD